MTLRLPGVDPLPEDGRSRVASAWFTPEWAADVLAEMAPGPLPDVELRILEPSVGSGALLKSYRRHHGDRGHLWTVVDIDAGHCRAMLDRRFSFPLEVHHADYLELPAPNYPYDLTIMNPPYEHGDDSAFVAKAMDESHEVVALVRLAMLESQRSYERVWSRVESKEWRLRELRVFTERPSFLLGGEASGGGKTAFMAIALTREVLGPRCNVSWVRR